MAFSDFTLPDLTDKFGVRLSEVDDLHAAVPEVPPPRRAANAAWHEPVREGPIPDLAATAVAAKLCTTRCGLEELRGAMNRLGQE